MAEIYILSSRPHHKLLQLPLPPSLPSPHVFQIYTTFSLLPHFPLFLFPNIYLLLLYDIFFFIYLYDTSTTAWIQYIKDHTTITYKNQKRKKNRI